MMRLLIVDDSDTMREYLAGSMRDLHHEVCECSDGGQAIQAYGTYHPDLVLMDIRMPGMDGFETTRRILRADPNAHVAIVTDYDSPEFRSRAEAVGAIRFFQKSDLTPLLAFVSES